MLRTDVSRIGAIDLAFVLPDGDATYVLENSSLNIADRNYFRKAMNGEKNIEVVVSRLSGNVVALFAVAIFRDSNPDAPVIGVLTARKDGEKTLSNLVVNYKNNMQSGYYYLVNEEGTVISHPNNDLVRNQFNLIKAAENDPVHSSVGALVASALRERKGISRYTFDGKALIGSYAEVPGYSWILFDVIDKITVSTDNVLTRFEAIDSSIKIVADQERISAGQWKSRSKEANNCCPEYLTLIT